MRNRSIVYSFRSINCCVIRFLVHPPCNLSPWSGPAMISVHVPQSYNLTFQRIFQSMHSVLEYKDFLLIFGNNRANFFLVLYVSFYRHSYMATAAPCMLTSIVFSRCWNLSSGFHPCQAFTAVFVFLFQRQIFHQPLFFLLSLRDFRLLVLSFQNPE